MRAHRLRFGVVYDFRNPPDSGLATPRLYGEILDQVAWLDRLGLDLVWFTEHHFVDDGYLPSWTPVVGAMAARTRRRRFSSDICILPFSHPLRLAEDLAVLDNLSSGRVEIGVGMGYVPHEFRGFGVPLPQRVSRTEEGLAVERASPRPGSWGTSITAWPSCPRSSKSTGSPTSSRGRCRPVSGLSR